MSVMELQSKYFPIQPRATLLSSATGVFPTTPKSDEDKPLIRLREPRDLYSTTSLQHPPKWPIECQVIPEKIRHTETVSSNIKLEHFYVSSGSEPQPKPVGEEMGTVIYDYQPKLSVDYFCRSCVGGSEDLQIFESPDANTLKFESRFESGNLAKAIKVTNVYYELYLRQDLYTDRHSQWFYFRIQNTKENLTYRFSIVNFNKADSLYKYGLKVLMYSEKEAQLNKAGWVRCGQNIAYYKNDCSSDENAMLYTLSFNLKFKHSNDTVYLAHCYPYTYSTLQNYLRELEEDNFKSQLLTVRLLARSLAGNNVYVVTVTSPDNYLEESVKKPVIFLSARVHPGETQSSYMMKGIIDFITSNCPQAQELRDRFIFKLIPMLNPDGVIVGNSRCCLLGLDLNRQYRTVLREAFPQIYHAKVLLRRLVEENGVFLYCDIHGHSRRNNVFIYGCENRKFPDKKLIEQVFPLMMHKNAADKFSFQNCKFRVQKNKEGTGRVFAWTLGIVNSYTLEISLGGSTMPSRQYTHFNTADYEAVGRHFCETLMDFSDPSPKKEQLRDKILIKLTEGGSNADEPVNVPLTDYSSLSHSETEPENSGDEEKKEEAERVMSISKKLKIPKKRIKTMPIPIKGDAIRPPLALNKTSVEMIRIGQTSILQKHGDQVDASVTREIALFKRLTKFRRKPNWSNKPALPGGIIERDLNMGKVVPKCTSILFDDPFNPPGGFDQKRFKEPLDMHEEYDDDSGTEDECDERDGTITNKAFAQTQNILTEEFSLLNLSGPHNRTSLFVDKQKLQITTQQQQPQTMLSANPFPKPNSHRTSPFTPRLPEGKSLRSFYSIDYEDTLSGRLNKVPLETGRRASLSSLTKYQQPQDIKRNNHHDSPRKSLAHNYQRGSVFRSSRKDEPTRTFAETKSQSNKHKIFANSSSNRSSRSKQSFLTKSKSIATPDYPVTSSSGNKTQKYNYTIQDNYQSAFFSSTLAAATTSSSTETHAKLKGHGHGHNSSSKKKGKSKNSGAHH